MQKRVRIKDIALKAGVSAGTVDRVLHQRGHVSDDSREKVLRTLGELGYERNLLASALAYNRSYRIGALLPDPAIDPYWEQPNAGIQKAYRSIQHFGIELNIRYFDLFDPADFSRKAGALMEEAPDGILFPPIFGEEGQLLIDACRQTNTAVVLFNTQLASESILGYIGQDSYQSGFLAGRLLSFALKARGTVVVLNLEKEITNALHILEKERGFRDYFRQHRHDDIQVVRHDIENFSDNNLLRQFWQEQVLDNPAVTALFVTNSRAYYLRDCLAQAPVDRIKIVGYDLVGPNIDLLRAEKINFLVNQNSVEQGYLGIMTLFRYLFLQEQPEQLQYLPLDIVVAENVQYYLKKQESLLLMV